MELKQRRDLIAALVGDPYRERYLTSAAFKVRIDMLAQILELIVEGFAAASDESTPADPNAGAVTSPS